MCPPENCLEGLIWVVTKTDARWARIELDEALVNAPQHFAVGWIGRGRRGERALPTLDWAAPDGNNPLPFDLGRAHDLYRSCSGSCRPHRTAPAIVPSAR
jgi:hypothetical protein